MARDTEISVRRSPQLHDRANNKERETQSKEQPANQGKALVQRDQQCYHYEGRHEDNRSAQSVSHGAMVSHSIWANCTGTYLRRGGESDPPLGFAGFLREHSPQILQELLRDIVQRDIAVRYRLRGTRNLLNLMLFLLANPGRPFSRHALTRALQIPTVAQTSSSSRALKLPAVLPDVRVVEVVL